MTLTIGIRYALPLIVVRCTGVVAYNSGPMRTERELIYPDCVNPLTGIPDVWMRHPPFRKGLVQL